MLNLKKGGSQKAINTPVMFNLNKQCMDVF